MEELRAPKLALIRPIIEAVGASFICLSHTLAYFNSLEQWLSLLNFFLLWFAPHTRPLLIQALQLPSINIKLQHLRNWEN